MFKALKIIAPYIVGSVFALLIVTLIFGISVAVKAIVPAVVGMIAAFIAALCFKR